MGNQMKVHYTGLTGFTSTAYVDDETLIGTDKHTDELVELEVRYFEVAPASADAFGDAATVTDVPNSDKACPECVGGKHGNCPGDSLCPELTCGCWQRGHARVDAGVRLEAERMAEQRDRDNTPCPTCRGDRLRPDYSLVGLCHAPLRTDTRP